MAARQRRNRMLMRGGGIAVGGGALVALTVGGLIAVAPWPRSTESAAPAAARVVAPAKKSARAHPKSEQPSPQPAPARSEPPLPPPAPVKAPPQLAIRSAVDGRIELADSVFAERAGESEVTVHFDNGIWRTRFEEKFERLVRTTLPSLLGADAKAALDSVPQGQLVRGGDLMRDLPTRGIRIALPAPGRTLTIFPITRPGETGPLVVAYRATVSQ